MTMADGETSTTDFSADQLEQALAYAHAYYKDPHLLEVFGPLLRSRPEVFQGYIALRQAAFNTGPQAALSPKMKELIILAIEVGCRKTNPPPLGHTRRAMEAGATVAEIAEVVSLCIMIAGMLTYHESGMHVLHAAEEYADAHPPSDT
jgi:alkylhydroperoxidase/carboxymuconolactone decarboxylase family protein YurZ